MDQDRFAGAQASAGDQVVKDGEQVFRQGRSLESGPAVRDWQYLNRGGYAEFGITPTRNNRADPLAGMPVGHLIAYAFDYSRHIKSGDIGCPWGGGYLPWRCMISARETPAASTRMSTSPGFGFGFSRSAGFRTSGPPNEEISITSEDFLMIRFLSVVFSLMVTVAALAQTPGNDAAGNPASSAQQDSAPTSSQGSEPTFKPRQIGRASC